MRRDIRSTLLARQHVVVVAECSKVVDSSCRCRMTPNVNNSLRVHSDAEFLRWAMRRQRVLLTVTQRIFLQWRTPPPAAAAASARQRSLFSRKSRSGIRDAVENSGIK